MLCIVKYTVCHRVEFDQAQAILKQEGGAWALFQEHVEAWRKTWEGGRLEVILLEYKSTSAISCSS